MRYVIGVLLSIVCIMQIFLIIKMAHKLYELEKAISKSDGRPIARRYSNDEIHENNEQVYKGLLYLIVLLLPLTLLIYGLFANHSGAITWAIMEFVLIAVISNVYYGIRKAIE